MKKKIRKAVIAVTAGLLAGAAVLSGGCSGKTPARNADTVKVITVNFPPYDFVKQITGGDTVRRWR